MPFRIVLAFSCFASSLLHLFSVCIDSLKTTAERLLIVFNYLAVIIRNINARTMTYTVFNFSLHIPFSLSHRFFWNFNQLKKNSWHPCKMPSHLWLMCLRFKWFIRHFLYSSEQFTQIALIKRSSQFAHFGYSLANFNYSFANLAHRLRSLCVSHLCRIIDGFTFDCSN